MRVITKGGSSSPLLDAKSMMRRSHILIDIARRSGRST